MISIMIPVYNEHEVLGSLFDKIKEVMQRTGRKWEVIFVNDGSSDNSGAVLDKLADANPEVKVVHFRRNFGQTAAMMAGFDYAQGEVIIPMDGDYQNDPEDIPRMLEKIEEGYDVVSGWRKDRQDNALSRNIREFYGKPIISYPIEAAKKSGCFDEIMVSTDSDEIAEIARHYGAVVPFKRSEETSHDSATSTAVLSEVLHCYKEQGREFDLMCMFYPAAPFVTPEKIKEGYDYLAKDPSVDSAFTVVRYGHPIQRAFRVQDGLVSMISPEHRLSHSQNLEPAYHDAAQFYWMRVNPFLQSGRIFAERSAPIILLETEVQDIDHEEDWQMAEIKFSLWKNRVKH